MFTIPNSMDGFHCLLQRIRDCSSPQDKIKVGLEATGHYSSNILGFLLDNGLPTHVLNLLHTNLYRKSLSLRKAKTDRVDAQTIAAMLFDVGLKPYTDTAYHNEELTSLARYRFDKVKERGQLKQWIARLVCILFPELEKLVPTLHMAPVYAMLEELHSPITAIPGIGYRMGAMILAETGDFSQFESPDKLLAYAGLSPSAYQSGQLKNCYAPMEKRGSRYLRYAIFNATKYVCLWGPVFSAYLAKKRAEGKHYNIAIPHAAKKLVWLIYA